MNTAPQTIIIIVLCLTRFSAVRGTDREFQGTVVYSRDLDSTPLRTLFTNGAMECAHRCLTHSKCVSFNYKSTGWKKGFCKLNSKSASQFPDQVSLLRYNSNFIFVQKLITEPRSCLDHYNTGARTSSIYHIYDSEGKNYKVFCDMTSEANSVWTLVMSQSFENRALIGFRLRGLMNDKQINADEPTNWSAYRLSHQRMIDLRSKSTHWRITCSFDTYGVDYRDYIRAKFSVFDPLTFTQTKECKRVEYMNVRGHNCSDCTACWSQTDGSVMLHHRSDERMCDLGRTPDAVSNEQCFGYYYDFNRSFRCTKTNIDSTNHWFGAYV